MRLFFLFCCLTIHCLVVSVAADCPPCSKVEKLGEDIVGSTVTCSDDEKTSLMSLEAEVEQAAALVESALEEAQNDLLAATGSTASAAALASAGAETTTKSSRSRLRNFQWMKH